MREKLQSLPVGELRKIAKENGIKSVTTLRKQQLVDMILEVTQRKEKKLQAVNRKQLKKVKQKQPQTVKQYGVTIIMKRI